MRFRKELERRLTRKNEEAADLERRLAEVKSYIQALLDSLKLLPKQAEDESSFFLRPGSDIAKARDVLKKHGEPMHITKLLKGLGKDITKSNRISLSGSISAYVRKGIIFTRPEPNTFGLIEFSQDEKNGQIPEDFGLEEAKTEEETL